MQEAWTGKLGDTTADVVENDEVVLYWDVTIETDMAVAHNRPDIIMVEKAIQKWTIIDIPVPGDFNVVRTEDLKVEKYQDLNDSSRNTTQGDESLSYKS